MSSGGPSAPPPVVLVNGLPWDLPLLVGALEERYELRVFQVPGWEDFRGGYSLQDMAADLAGRMNNIMMPPYSLVGVSTGADVALWRTLYTPDEVESLVLISPTGIRPTGAAAGTPVDSLPDLMLAHPERLELPNVGQSLLDDAALLLQSGSDETGLRNSLAEVRCATLAVFGQEDRLVSPEAGRHYKELVPNCNVAFVYDAGHAIPLERPEAVINLTLDFLERRETYIVENRSWMINP